MDTQQADKEFARRRNLVAVSIGGVGLWLFLSAGLQVIGQMSRDTGATPDWLQRYPIPWHLGTLAASLVVAAALALAQSGLRKQSLGTAASTGVLMGLPGSFGLLAGSLNTDSGKFEVAAIRAAVLFLGVIGTSVLVFAFRKRE